MTIIIDGRRWFQRSAGNTYHSVTVTVIEEGKPPVTMHSGQHYGYGDSYVQTAAELLAERGYLQDANSIYSDMINHRDKYILTVADVSREKDL